MTGVTLLDASLVQLPSHHRPMNWTQEIGVTKYVHATGFSFKAYALAFVTTFDEVLILDSDNLPLQNPERLFSSPQYLQKGSSFWPDWWQRSKTQTIPFWLDVDPFAYNTFGLSAPWEVSTHPMTATESGTMLVDRSASALLLLCLRDSYPTCHGLESIAVCNRLHYFTYIPFVCHCALFVKIWTLLGLAIAIQGTLSLHCSSKL